MEFENLRSLMIADRSVRRFDESKKISSKEIEKLIELTRYCASGRNLQPLKYKIVIEEEEKERIFPLLKWAGYLLDWAGPAPGERPAAYIIQCLDSKYGSNCLCDDGLQLEAITLGMTAMGLGGCIIKSFDHVGIAHEARIDGRYLPRYVVALGYPAEKVQIEDMSGDEDADFKYYRDPDGIHHVPKRPLNELLI